MRIDVIDKINLPWPMPVFQLLFAGYGTVHIAQHLRMNQPMHTIFGSKSVRMLIAVLIHALHQIGRHADIDRAVMPARQHIDAGLLFFSHLSSDALKWTLKQVQGDGLFYLIVLAKRHLKNHRQLNNQRHPELVSGSIYPHSPALIAWEIPLG
jgi:hypothetical protein